MLDKIIIKNLKIFAYHGVNTEEKEAGQNFILDVVIHMPQRKNNFVDSLDTTLNYSKVIKSLKKIVTENRFDLIETVAEKTAKELIFEFESIIKLEVEVKKPEAPIKADFDYVSVKIKRKRSDYID